MLAVCCHVVYRLFNESDFSIAFWAQKNFRLLTALRESIFHGNNLAVVFSYALDFQNLCHALAIFTNFGLTLDRGPNAQSAEDCAKGHGG